MASFDERPPQEQAAAEYLGSGSKCKLVLIQEATDGWMERRDSHKFRAFKAHEVKKSGAASLRWARLEYSCRSHDFLAELEMNSSAKVTLRDLKRALRNGCYSIVEAITRRREEADSAFETYAKDDTTRDNANMLVSLQGGNCLSVRRVKPIPSWFNSNWTPLQWSCRCEHFPLINLLIERGAEMNKFDKFNKTPLSSACGNGQLSVAKLLIERGADFDRADSNGFTPFYWACIYHHTRIAQLLVDKGIDLTRSDKFGCTALHWASGSGSLPVTKLLIERGADLAKTNLRGISPFNDACDRGHVPVAKFLIEKGADVNRPGKKGLTELQLSVRNSRTSIAELLLQMGADADMCDVIGRTPLHFALICGNTSALDTLFDAFTRQNRAWYY